MIQPLSSYRRKPKIIRNLQELIAKTKSTSDAERNDRIVPK